MLTNFYFTSDPWLLPLVMLAILALSIEVPYRFGSKKANTISDDAFNVMQTGLFTLSAFVLGLSFAQASGRFDARRELVVKEANAIGTTWLRADQLQPAQTAQFRNILTGYAAARLKAYGTPGDPPLYQRTIEQSDRDQAAMWSIASTSLRGHESNLGLSLLMQTLNDTIDVSAAQLQALTSRVPTAMVTLTLLLVVLTTLTIGLRFARDGSRPPLVSALFVASCVIVISMMVDYDRPQTGFVTVSLKPLVNQLHSMQTPP